MDLQDRRVSHVEMQTDPANATRLEGPEFLGSSEI